MLPPHRDRSRNADRDQTAAQGRAARRRPRHPLPARHQGDGQGDAAGGGQAADPVRGRGGARRRHRAVLHGHRPRQDRAGRAFRHRLRAGGDAARARQDRRAGDAARCAAAGRARSSRCASRSRSASATRSGAPAPSSATIRSPSCCPTTWCCRTSPACSSSPTPIARPAAAWSRSTEVPREQTNRYGILDIGHDDGRLVEVTGLVEKPAAGGRAVQPVDHRPLRADARGDRAPRAHGARRRQRGAAYRRHGAG